MGGRGSSSMGAKKGGGGIIGNEKPLELARDHIRSRAGRAKENIYSVNVSGKTVEVGYSRPESYERVSSNRNREHHKLVAGFYTDTWAGDVKTHNIDLSKADVVRGETYDLRSLLKESGFTWNPSSKEWRRR